MIIERYQSGECCKNRVPLYDRLPEIYRIKDREQYPPDQLKHYLALVEAVFAGIHKNIEALYHDLFIETCDDWVIPYIGDLLGVSHLKGDPAALRSEVAETIALRRRKGTLAGIERLTYNLTRWGVHCVELRENLVWNQHLNHQRPDRGAAPLNGGAAPPYGLSPVTRFTPVRGGTVTLRDPAMLSLLYTPFDPFAHITDIKPVPTPALGNARYNLPNLAIFLWRLKDYRVCCSKPVHRGKKVIDGVFCARFDIHPLGEPVRLFNTYGFDPDREPPVVTRLDETPNPLPTARLNENSQAGSPEKYAAVDIYDSDSTDIASLDIADAGLQLHLPEKNFRDETWPNRETKTWTIRGANLYAWEEGLKLPVKNRDIIIDPVIGRIIFGVGKPSQAIALRKNLLVTYTYGAVGPVGAHPIPGEPSPNIFNGEKVKTIDVRYGDGPGGLKEALNKADMANTTLPVVIQIPYSMTYELDIKDVTGVMNTDGDYAFMLNKSLIIRAADDQRPVIKLARPLRFRPKNAQDELEVRLEGLYLTRDKKWKTNFPTEPQKVPLVARAALNRLEIIGCTFDPGGYKKLDGKRSSIYASINLKTGYGFSDPDEEGAFDQTPEIIIKRSVTGPLFIDSQYRLFLNDSIIDGGRGVNDAPAFALSGAGPAPEISWGPPTEFEGITVFGRMRVEQLSGKGGIFVHMLEVLNHQTGCIKFSYFSGKNDRLPQNHGCVKGTEAQLRFVSEIFGQPAYGQLHHNSDWRIHERGPGDDAMGAFGFLMESHKWRNLQERFREFIPIGVRPILIPVT